MPGALLYKHYLSSTSRYLRAEDILIPTEETEV